MKYLLLNPKANNGRGKHDALEWAKCLNEEYKIVNVLEIADMKAFIQSLLPEDIIILTGGDGTINHFANDVEGLDIENDIYYVKCGSGNDFFRDRINDADENGMIPLNKFLKNLPIINVNGISRRFINGIGYGIDGETCRIGDELREKSDKPINYTNIAIKLLLGSYKLRKARITIDGETYEYKNIWMVPTMKGRYYGGGMMVAPDQDRSDLDNKVSVVCVFKKSRLVTLMRFPSIYEGKHVLKTDWIKVYQGKKIDVEFDTPCALQIDGETIKDVIRYSVRVPE